MTERTVNNLGEFIAAALDIAASTSEQFWYRGLRKTSYLLEPSLFRAPYKQEHESIFVENFRAMSRPYISSDYQHDWEIYFHMQHYGVPTRLLDWTTDPLCALAFALFGTYTEDKSKDSVEPTEDAVVYILNITKLNDVLKSAWNMDSLSLNSMEDKPIINDYAILSLESSQQIKEPRRNLCIPIEPPLINERIIVQKAKFTLFPHSPDSSGNILNMERNVEYLVGKIILNKSHIPTIKRQIRQLGISKQTLYPCLDSLSFTIKEIVL